MSAFRNIERSRIDHLLVETIKQVGVSNYSLISRLTGLNAETVRYKVNKQLNRMGLGIFVNVDYEGLGLRRGIFFARAAPSQGKSWLDHTSYLTFVGKVMGLDRYLCIYAIPYRLKKKYLDSLSYLQQTGLVEELLCSDISWVRYPPFRSEFYDFDKGCWHVDWNRVAMTMRETGTTFSVVNRDVKLDYFDVKILKCLQEDPTCNITKAAKEISANARTVRYHYSEHVLKNKFILGNNVRWVKPVSDNKPVDLMHLVFCFSNLSKGEIDLARKTFNKIPFTWLEIGTEDNKYFAFLDLSLTSFHETVRFVERSTLPIRNRLEMITLDPFKTTSLNIPDEMYDKERGWTLSLEPSILAPKDGTS